MIQIDYLHQHIPISVMTTTGSNLRIPSAAEKRRQAYNTFSKTLADAIEKDSTGVVTQEFPACFRWESDPTQNALVQEITETLKGLGYKISYNQVHDDTNLADDPGLYSTGRKRRQFIIVSWK